jgi:hypothetical protein
MNSETVTCSSCGAQIPASARFCQECGHVNAAASSGIASPPPTGSILAGPVAGSSEEASSLSAGAPTLNIGSSQGYTPPPSASGWQPGQYGSAPGGYPAGEPSRVEPTSRPAYAPPPEREQPSYALPVYDQTQALPQYGAQPQPAAPGYGGCSEAPMNYQYQTQVGVAGIPWRDPTIALLLELIGYVWVLGIGHMYGGRIGRGIALLVGWACYWIIVAVLFFTLIGIPVACVMALIWPVVPILSGLWIRSDLEKANATLRERYP